MHDAIQTQCAEIVTSAGVCSVAYPSQERVLEQINMLVILQAHLAHEQDPVRQVRVYAYAHVFLYVLTGVLVCLRTLWLLCIVCRRARSLPCFRVVCMFFMSHRKPCRLKSVCTRTRWKR